MNDLILILLTIGIVLALDALGLSFYYNYRNGLHRTTINQLSPPACIVIVNIIGFSLSAMNLAQFISQAIFFHYLDISLWDYCHSIMKNPDDCDKASELWGKWCWTLIVFFIASVLVLISGIRRAYLQADHTTRLWSLGFQIRSCGLYQLSLLLSTPLVYSSLFFNRAAPDIWRIVCLVLVILMIGAYTIATIALIEGFVWFLLQFRTGTVASRRRNRDRPDVFLLENVGSTASLV